MQADRLVVGSYDGGLYCVRAADGGLLWKYDAHERIHGTPAVIVADPGQPQPTTSEAPPLRPSASAPVSSSAEPLVLVPACDSNLHVVRLVDGTLVRKVPLGTVTAAAAAVGSSRVFLPGYAEQVLAVDWRAGELAWRFQDPERQFPFQSSAAVTDDLVIFGGHDKRVRALERSSGTQRWEFATKGKIDSSPVVVGQRVFIGAADGNLYELDLATGRERWRFDAGAPISASPAVAAGCLVIGTEAGTVYCFGKME